MSTLSQYYKQKGQNGTGTTVKKTFMVPYEELYTIEGEQGRPLNKEHAEKMGELWISGTDLPPLLVEVTERGVKVIDGQHRYVGAGYARQRGFNIPRIECKDFIGTDLEKLAIQTGSSEGLQITPIERAINYNKARKKGHTVAEIAKAFHRSVTDVENHLQLLSSGETLIAMVNSGEVSATTAVELSKKHGPSAGRIASDQLKKAKAAGKKKLTKSAAMPQFSASKARRLVELLCDSRYMGVDGDEAVLYHDNKYTEEVRAIINAYRDSIPTEEGDI